MADLLFVQGLLEQKPWLVAVFVIVIVWVITWKGIALWKAASKRDLAWFVALLILNTLSILEILYIFIFSKRKSLAPTRLSDGQVPEGRDPNKNKE